MKVLYVGYAQGFQNADKFYLLPQKIINGFTRSGHNVYVFNDRDYARYSNIFRSSRLGIPAVNRKLLEVCGHFQPALIVLGHCEMIANETLARIRSICAGVKIVYRNVDPLCYENNVRNIMQRSGHVDGIFITTAGEILKQFAHPDTFVCHMPNLVDNTIETSRAFASDQCDIDLLFAGHMLGDDDEYRRSELNNLINALHGINFRVVGAVEGSPCIFGQEYMNLLARSKMGLCINKTCDYYLYSSDRMSQYMGSGMLVYIHANHRFSDVFGSDALIEYQDTRELTDKVLYYAQHDRERRKIAQTGWTRMHDFFDCRKVAQYIVERAFALKLSQEYHWPVELY